LRNCPSREEVRGGRRQTRAAGVNAVVDELKGIRDALSRSQARTAELEKRLADDASKASFRLRELRAAVMQELASVIDTVEKLSANTRAAFSRDRTRIDQLGEEQTRLGTELEAVALDLERVEQDRETLRELQGRVSELEALLAAQTSDSNSRRRRPSGR
jgi:chromosome segregation ATPase